MFWITLTLKCLAIVAITGLVMAQMPEGRATDVLGTLAWVGLCALVIRRSLRQRAL